MYILYIILYLSQLKDYFILDLSRFESDVYTIIMRNILLIYALQYIVCNLCNRNKDIFQLRVYKQITFFFLIFIK